MSQAKIVVGFLFGDEGKGITTDYLCSLTPDSSIVIRFSGGQQAGHNVRIGEKTHIHASFGSGTLRGVPSYFSEHCSFYPVTMYNEWRVLIHKGIRPELYIHPLARVTTPADLAFNRINAIKTGHGSCGLGVGSTLKRNFETPYKLFAIDLLHKDILNEKMKSIFFYYRNLINNDSIDYIAYFDEIYEQESEHFMSSLSKLSLNIRPYSFLTSHFKNFIFEGSQGIMLDMDHGIFPYVTYSNTTSKNAIEISKKIGIKDIEIYYVTRCYQTRHGAGWMSNEDPIELINTEDEINVFNEWQKNFRIGEIDYDLLNYAHSIDNIYSNGIKKNLVVTCMDQRPDFEFDHTKLETKFCQILYSYSPDSKTISNEQHSVIHS